MLGPYKTTIEVLVRDHIPIKYRYWVGKDDVQPLVVPNSLKDKVWRRVVDVIRFTGGCNMELAKQHGLQIMSTSFKTFKGELNKHIRNGTEPNWEKLPSQLHYWDEFKEYKL